MDGLSLLRQLRSDRHLAHVPVVFLSSDLDPTPQVTALNLDVLDWLTKPIDRERLRARVQSALARVTLSAAAEAVDDSEMSNADVLVVDDDPTALDVVVKALAPGRFELRTATNAADALHQVGRKAPEVVLVDVSMPGIDGFQLAARMFSMPEMANSPLIFITQHGALDMEVKALRMGAFDFVGKPFVPEILRARVGNAVRMRRRSVRALEQSDAHWRRVNGQQVAAIIAQAHEPIIVLDERSGIVLANAAARNRFGDSSDLKTGAPMPPWLDHALPAPVRCGAAAQVTDLEIRRPNQSPAFYDVSSAVLGTGTPRLVALTFHDQTPRRQAEAAERNRIRLEAERRTRQLMMSYLMHEIGNPLNGVMGLTQLLLAPGAGPLTDAQRRRLELVAESADVLRRLMADGLDMARHEAGTFSVQVDPVPVRAVVEAALALAAPGAARNRVDLALPVGDLDAAVLADAVRLRQCLDNLIGNACKYSRGRGRVAVIVLAGPLETEISVTDNGPGLDGDQIARLFVPFERLGEQRAPGHGLGLACTRMLAQAMAGRLEVASEPGVGSRFTLVLPTAPAAGRAE